MNPPRYAAIEAPVAAAAAQPAHLDLRARGQARAGQVRFALDSMREAVLCTDLHDRVSYLNAAAAAMTGWPADSAIGRPLAEVFVTVDPGTGSPFADPEQPEAEVQAWLPGARLLVRRDGTATTIEESASPVQDEAGRVVGTVIVVRDVGPMHALALDMMRLAHHDALTGLPNRLLLAERLAQAIGQARRHRKQVALLFIDLDGFKQINDSLGHAAGDRLLGTVARRLQECVRETDTVCRLGGDEFVILLAEIALPLDAMRVAEKLLGAFAAPNGVDGHQLQVSLSIGISVFPDDARTVDAVMGNADSAMYQAKTRGGNTYQVYRAEPRAPAVRGVVQRARNSHPA